MHIVYGSPFSMDYSDLIGMIEIFALVETVEFKNAGLFDDLESNKNDT